MKKFTTEVNSWLYGLTNLVTPEHPSGSSVPEALYCTAKSLTFAEMQKGVRRAEEDGFTPLYFTVLLEDGNKYFIFIT